MADFKSFGKIPRLSNDCVITEKIDGTNACVVIQPFSLNNYEGQKPIISWTTGENPVEVGIWAQSRKRFITPGKDTDNHGFAQWVLDNYHELKKLGLGYHYGEWVGNGINRNYNLKEKRFYLFNVGKWSDDSLRPTCCYVVPMLAKCLFDTQLIDFYLNALQVNGSFAVPGFMKPEGIIIYHNASGYMFKKTLDGDKKGI